MKQIGNLNDFKIKTFPLHFASKELEIIKECAKESGLSTKQFMTNAIRYQVEQMNKEA